ncbi:MAG TPA: FAD-binding oxidoreductase [Bryobacteraceae bacterium]|nr:FAD-binding oxidoreductase [Bryobacteraceae bacterium]
MSQLTFQERQPRAADSTLDRALEEFAAAVGREHVITSASALNEAGKATFATSQAPAAIVRPADRSQVQACVRIANRVGISLYPISSGKNWGYGSRVPTADGAILLDLGRMNRIVDFSEELAYATVEPGVTQRQLQDFLKKRGSHLMMDVTGASPDCALIGNTLERGFGHTPYGDHFAQVCGLEVVLPDGECVETGFARFDGAKAAALNRWGLGPVLDGLFSQSNLGIVTRMTVWLMPAPEYFQSFCCRCDGEEGIAALIDALRPLRLNGTLRSTVHIGNDYKVISAIRQYPWEEMGGETPLGGPVLAKLRKQFNVGSWNASGGLYGTRAQVAEARRLLRRALRGKVDKLQFLDERMVRIAARFARPYRWFTGWDLSRTLELLRPVLGLMQGVPTEHPLSSAYWRKRAAPPVQMNPDRDGCGLLWCSPIAPATGGHALELTRIACKVLLEHRFEPAISISMVSERSLACVISITYDRNVPGEDERAAQCHDELKKRLAEKGYYPYRLDIRSMGAMQGQPAYTGLLRNLKRALDPANVLSPGRYIPGA